MPKRWQRQFVRQIFPDNARVTNDHPLLSILIPVYNVERYLAECVESIFAQNPEYSVEVLLLDDCSTDGSRAIANQLRQKHPENIRLLSHRENRGISAVRNSLLEAAQGEYIWFLDSDDKLLGPSLRRLGELVERHRPDIILCDYCREDGIRIPTFEGPAGSLEQDREALVRGVFVVRKMHNWSKISRRALWEDDLRFPEGKLFEDIPVCSRLLLRAKTYFHAPEKWIYYREHRDSLTQRVALADDFDEARHDDYAEALTGFVELFEAELGPLDPATHFAIAHFQAKIFRQTGFKIIKAIGLRGRFREMARLIRRYRTIIEAASPIPFDQLLRQYWLRSRISCLIFLGLFCFLASMGTGRSERVSQSPARHVK